MTDMLYRYMLINRHSDAMPKDEVYDALIALASREMRMSEEQIRKLYGLYTFAEWCNLLNIE